jgi:PKD repeat protein
VHGAQSPFRWQSSGQSNSTNYDSGYFKTVYLGWPLEGLYNNPGARTEILEAVVNWFGECCEPVSDADFTWEPVTPAVGELVTFTASATGTAPITYSWKLEVGSWKTGPVVTHTYNLTGVYTVVLTATNDCGEQAVTNTLTVTPEPPPCEPVHSVLFDWTPLVPVIGQVVTFTASATGTTPITYSWKLDVGSWQSGQVVTHSYVLPGDYTIILTATNCVSATAQASTVITVLPEPGEHYVYLPLVSRE